MLKKLATQNFLPLCNFSTAINWLADFPAPKESFRASETKITLTTNQKKKPLFDQRLPFGTFTSDHLAQAEWTKEKGWAAPEVKPYDFFKIDPINSTLHYAVECYEGMKAYKDAQGRVRLFRPNCNANRMRHASKRLSLPDYDPKDYVELVKQFCRADADWIPSEYGYSLYIRPTHISMMNQLGLHAANASKLFFVGCPVGPYYASGFKAINLYLEQDQIRAAPKGCGCYKLGSNYGPTIQAGELAEKKGFQQILWLFENQLTEIGTSNLFMFWKNKNGEDELVTPYLDEGLILPGITRNSILTLAKEMNRFKVSEKKITVEDTIEALEQGRVKEVFASGTAVIVGPVKSMHYGGKTYQIKIDEKLNAGPLTKEFYDKIIAIQYGKVDHPWSVIV